MLIHNVSLNCYHFVCNIHKFYETATAAIKYGICISGTIFLLIAFTRTFQSNNGCHQGCCYSFFFVTDSQLVFAFVAALFLKGFVNKIVLIIRVKDKIPQSAEPNIYLRRSLIKDKVKLYGASCQQETSWKMGGKQFNFDRWQWPC